MFLAPSYVLASEQFDASVFRAQYASTLLQLADSEDYVIECGNSDVLNSPTTFSEFNQQLDVAICTLALPSNPNKPFAVMFSSGDEENVLEHLPSYFEESEIGDPNAIYLSKINLAACENAQPVEDNWLRCSGAVTNSQVPGYNTHVFVRLGSNSLTYLVTINFVPQFAQGWWSNFLSFFTNFFGFGTNTQDIIEFEEGFTRGYFAKITKDGDVRRIQATFQADNPTSHGRATIIFDQFVEDVSELAPDARRVVGSGKQALIFDEENNQQTTISPARWKQLTATLRLNPIPGEPHPDTQTVCGDDRLDFGEQCEENSISSSCEALGFVGGELSCHAPGSSNQCTYDVSGCVACQDKDDDGHPADNVLPASVRAIMSEPLIELTNGETTPTTTTQLITIPEPSQELLTQLETLVTNKAPNIEDPEDYGEYRAAAQDITTFTNNLRAFLEEETALPTSTTTKPIMVINLTNIFEGEYGLGAQTHVEEALRTTLFCAAVGQATKQLENNQTHFLFYFDEITSQEYDQGYWFCREGLRTAQEQLYFTNELHEDLFTTTGPRIDAIMTNDPEVYVREKKIFATPENSYADMTYRDLRRALNGQLIVQSTNIISAYRANPVAIIVPENQYAQTNMLHQELSGHDLYIPQTNTLATTPTIIKRDSDGTEILYLQPLETRPINLPGLDTSCEGVLEELSTNNFITSNDGLDNLQTKTYRYTVNQANCVIGPFTQGSCPVTPEEGFDCNDNNPQTHPGATQLCDGQDNNCDGSAENPDVCVEMCDTRPIELENIVVRYDANTNFDYRYTREGASCDNPTCASYTSQGPFFSTPTNDPRAVPLHRWWNSNSKNSLYTRAGSDCAALEPAQRTPSRTECMGEDLTNQAWELRQENAFNAYPTNQQIPGTIVINRFYVEDDFGKTTHIFVEQGGIPPHTVVQADGPAFRVFRPNLNTVYEDPCEDTPPNEPITPPGGSQPPSCGTPPDNCIYGVLVCNACFGDEWQCFRDHRICP